MVLLFSYVLVELPYFFNLFSSKTILKNLDPSYKMDLDLLGLFRKGKTCIMAKFHKTDLAICSHSREEKSPSYSWINTVHMNFWKMI